MSDAICLRCGDDCLTDYPVCDECATVAHFTHRKCIHCERKRVAAAQREEIVTLLHDLLVAEEYGYEGCIQMRIRLHSLAKRAAALLARMGEKK